MHTTITSLFGAAQLRQEGTARFQNDQSDFGGGQPKPPAPAADQPDPNTGQISQPPDVASAPYIKLLTKRGYEYIGGDEDLDGLKIGSSFQGPDGDMILMKDDGTWMRLGPGQQRSQGPDVNSLGNALVRDSLQQGDDSNHHSALRQAGYVKIHADEKGNHYYKHPQSGKTVTVHKTGHWGSSVGSGRGASKLRDFLGNEAMADSDPNMMKMKMQNEQMKLQNKQTQQMKRGMPGGNGTRGAGAAGTRGGGAAGGGARMGGRGGF